MLCCTLGRKMVLVTTYSFPSWGEGVLHYIDMSSSDYVTILVWNWEWFCLLVWKRVRRLHARYFNGHDKKNWLDLKKDKDLENGAVVPTKNYNNYLPPLPPRAIGKLTFFSSASCSVMISFGTYQHVINKFLSFGEDKLWLLQSTGF